MNNFQENKNVLIGETISQRTGAGPSDMVKGWQSMLRNLLEQLSSYLKPSQIVTFKQLNPAEQQIFGQITQSVKVPASVCGLYLSPSVRNQILYTNQGLKIPHEANRFTDDGVLLFSRPSSYNTLINVFLAHPPYTAAIDVYDQGALLAGYVYDSIDDCLASITQVLSTHLGSRHGYPP